MLNKNINKVRRIAKARFGLSIPSGNPYMTTNGLAIPGNSITQQNLLGTDYGAEFRNRAEQIMAPTNNLIDFNAKMGDLFSLKLQNDRNTSRAIAQMNTNGITTPKSTSPSLQQSFQRLGGWNTASQAVDLANSLLFSKQYSEDSAITTGLNNLWNTGAKIVSTVNPLFGFAMEAGSLVANTARSLGTGTDQQTDFDKFGDSTIGQLSGIGLINGMFGKKTRDFSANKATIEQVGGSYGGTVRNINEASEKAGKKYGLFSSGKRKQANRFIDRTESQQSTMTNIAKDASDLSSIAANMSDLNHIQYGFNLNGGYDQRYMRAAKFGTKIQRIKKLNLPTYKTGGQINGSVNLETQEIEWQPTIIEEVEQFEEGGTLWSPVILQSGGKAVDGITGAAPKITFESWYNLIPKDRNDTTQYNLRRAFELAPMEELEAWRTSSIKDLKDGKNHLNSVYLNPETGEYEFMKSKNHPTLKYELEWYNSDDPEAIQFRKQYDLDTSKDYYKYVPKKFKSGGKTETEKTEVEETTQKNIIPEGALHAHKHHMENSEGLTQKGIPVVDEDGEQQAEIEKNEIIFTLEVTKKLEELYSKYTDHEHSQKEKDEVAIEAGKLLVEQVLFNTEDRTGLISTLEKGGVIDGPK